MTGKLGLFGLMSAWLACTAAFARVPAYEFVPMSAQPIEVKGEMTEGRPPSVMSIPPGASQTSFDPGLPSEVEPNDTIGVGGTSTPLTFGANNAAFMQGTVFPNGDIDNFSFAANAGDKVYAMVMTSASHSGSTDSQLRIFGSDGSTLVEFDEDDGALGGLSSTIAGATLPAGTGTYYIQVKHFSATSTLRPYNLYVRVASGLPSPEVEGNDSAGTANPLPPSGWVSGSRDPAVVTEQDWYSMSLNAGDTVFLSLDLDPERDNVQWNGRLGIALLGDADNQIIVIDDGSSGSVANPLSEALVYTVGESGTYYAFVDSATAATGGPAATYHLNVSVRQAENVPNCTTYTSTNVPQSIGPNPGLVSSTITVPATTARIADLNVSIQLNHALMADNDVNLRSPAGNDVGLFNDIGATATGGQTLMDITVDDEAAIPFVFTVLRPIQVKPELNYALNWFDGENPSGVWTLDVRDDLSNTSGGTLTGWSIRICTAPPTPACPAGTTPALMGMPVYSEDFEANNGGFTHSGAADEWEYGTPNTAATTTTNPVASIIGCNGGIGCWTTDLDNTYDNNSNQDLVSPSIDLTAYDSMTDSIVVSWAQRYQMESATFDHYRVTLEEVGNPSNFSRLFEWIGATMTVGVGSPTTNIGESSGWSQISARADSLAGKTAQLRFHVDTDSSVVFAGPAIDDVNVYACLGGPVGCTFASSFGNATIDPSGTVVTISTCSFAGEYSTISGAVNGQTLRFTSSVATDFITIHSGTSAGPVIAAGTTPLTFANTFTGTLYAHWATDDSCGTQISCRNTKVQSVGCLAANGVNLALENDSVANTQTFEVCDTINVGPNYQVAGPNGDLTLRAGNKVVLGEGASVNIGGRLTIEIDPALIP